MQTGTRAEFAAHKGVNKSTVTRWDQAGKLVFADEQKRQINFDASEALIDQSADPAKHGVTLMHARQRVVKQVDAAMNESVPPEKPGNQPEAGSKGETTYSEFNRARADKESELAKLTKMRREEQEGLLIRREDVQRDIESLAVIISKGLDSIAARVMPLINAEPDPGKREALLQMEVFKVKSEFADAALKFSES